MALKREAAKASDLMDVLVAKGGLEGAVLGEAVIIASPEQFVAQVAQVSANKSE